MHSIHMVRARRVGPRKGDFERLVGEPREKPRLVQRDGAAAAERAENGRVADIARGHVERAQFLPEVLGVVHQREQVGQGNELAVVQSAADEARIAVAALLTVGDDVHARVQLCGHAQPHCIVGSGLELFLLEAPFHPVVHGLDHPARPRPAPHAHHGQRRDRRSRGGLGQSVAEADRFGSVDQRLCRGRALCESGRSPLRQRSLADQERCRFARCGRHRDQLVAGEAAPGRQVFLHRDLGGQNLQQAAARQRVDVTADEQQQAAAAVQIAAVEADVGGVSVSGAAHFPTSVGSGAPCPRFEVACLTPHSSCLTAKPQ
jgi:hypothetical protein